MISSPTPGQSPPPPGVAVRATGANAGKEVHARAKLARQLGFLGLICAFCAPVALVLGLIARREMARNPGRYSNASHALAGIVTGGLVSTVLLVSMAAAIVNGGQQQNTAPAALATEATSAPERPRAPVPVVEPKRVGGHVQRSDFGDEWPLTVEAGELSCEPPGAVFFSVGGVRYSVNGLAEARSFHAKDIEPIWARDEQLNRATKGRTVFRKSIAPLIQRGRELCK